MDKPAATPPAPVVHPPGSRSAPQPVAPPEPPAPPAPPAPVPMPVERPGLPSPRPPLRRPHYGR
jgi:hypothetical protein